MDADNLNASYIKNMDITLGIHCMRATQYVWK